MFTSAEKSSISCNDRFFTCISIRIKWNNIFKILYTNAKKLSAFCNDCIIILNRENCNRPCGDITITRIALKRISAGRFRKVSDISYGKIGNIIVFESRLGDIIGENHERFPFYVGSMDICICVIIDNQVPFAICSKNLYSVIKIQLANNLTISGRHITHIQVAVTIDPDISDNNSIRFCFCTMNSENRGKGKKHTSHSNQNSLCNLHLTSSFSKC